MFSSTCKVYRMNVLNVLNGIVIINLDVSLIIFAGGGGAGERTISLIITKARYKHSIF